MTWNLATAADMLIQSARDCGLPTTDLHQGTIRAGDISLGFVRWPGGGKFDVHLVSSLNRKVETFDDPYAMVDRVIAVVLHHTHVHLIRDALDDDQ